MIRRPTIYRSNKFIKKRRKSSQNSTRIINLKSGTSSKYPLNKIITSKYTVWNFLPKNLFEQFRRICNFYFLCLAIIILIIETPVSPVTTIAPLIFVISVTGVKQAYEDYLRHKADREVNNNPIFVVRKGVTQTVPSKNIKVGDLVKIHKDQDIPCDLVFLMSSHSESKCFVTTINLDGETNLKTFHCPRSLKRVCKTETELFSLEATIKCENPTPHLYKFYGRIEFGTKTSTLLRQSALLREQLMLDQIESKKELLSVEQDDSDSEESNVGDNIYKKKLENQKRPPAYLKKMAKRTESFPKSAIKTHKKTYSNVERISFNLSEREESLPKIKEWSYEKKASLLYRRNPSLLRSNRPSLSTDGIMADPLSAENLLLRGSKLKGTEYIFGVAVYTGEDTKLSLNSKLSTNKFSTVEKSINKYLLFCIALLIMMISVSTVLKCIKESNNGYDVKIPFVKSPAFELSFVKILENVLSFFALYSNVIPISLYVTLEFQKFLGTLFFEWDLRMYNEETDETAICNTSDLNEDLGQIDYLFTDKTGTLTKNEMNFDRCSVNGMTYVELNGKLYPISEGETEPSWNSPVDLKNCSREMELFLCALTLCHTVQAAGGGETYNATSPDEKALIEAMKRLDIIFQDDADDMMAVKILGQCKVFKKLDVLEFSSERKRMSVIIEDDEENITLYCKGAETSVIPQVKKGPKEITLKHVANFAMERLRTLVVGYKFLSKEQYSKIADRLKQARHTLSSDREAIVDETYRKIESNLTVLGATGIRDDIQEEVKETLMSLKTAGIKIWMLTGDKLETAENISLECGHFEDGLIRLILESQKNPESCKEILLQCLNKTEKETSEKFGLIVDGESLSTALNFNRDLFRKVCVNCEAVICSRMSPLQKKEVVKLIKEQKHRPVTAAIGDGANDVSMIQEAHVGIGIMGKEGRQAVRCSDFAFSKFKYLRRAFLVHGHWYSIQNLYDAAYQTLFNSVFTSLPILIYGLVEQNYKDYELEKSPLLYCINRNNALMTWKNFLTWLLLGIWHAVVIFFVPVLYYSYNSSVLNGGRAMFLEAFGALVFNCSVTVVTLKLVLQSRYWSNIFVGSIVLSLAALFFFSIIFSLIYIEKYSSDNYWVFINMLGSPSTWLLIIFVCAVSLIPDFVIHACNNMSNCGLKIPSNF